MILRESGEMANRLRWRISKSKSESGRIALMAEENRNGACLPHMQFPFLPYPGASEGRIKWPVSGVIVHRPYSLKSNIFRQLVSLHDLKDAYKM